MSVYFHGNFGLNRNHMSGVLRAFLKNPNISNDKVAEPYGYRAPFTQRNISWLKKCGLIEKKVNKIKLTDFGKVIIEKDKKLDHEVSQWYLHHTLSGAIDNSETWYLFINKFLLKTKRFSKNELMEFISMQLMPHSQQHFGKGSKMTQTITRKIIECYTKKEALAELGIIKEVSKNVYGRLNPIVKGPWMSSEDLRLSY